MSVTSKPDEKALRTRLEGAAETLEVAQVRYRALTGVLRGLLWRERLFQNADVAFAVSQSWEDVEEALQRAQKLRASEKWAPRFPLSRLLDDVSALSDELRAQVAKKLSSRADVPVAEGLLILLDEVTPAPRGEALKWKLARAALPTSLPEVDEVRAFTAFLEALFSRPLPVGDGFAWTVQEARALEVQMPLGEAKVAELWRRVSQVESRDRVERMLLAKARFAPTEPPSDGPQTLVAAEFWRKLAWQKIHGMLEEHVAPVEVSDAEALRTFTFLAEAAQNPIAALSPSPTLKPARAALITLSRSLWQGAAAASEAEWERRLELARTVDAGPRDGDADRLIETLRMYSRVRRRGAGVKSGEAGPKGLVGALTEARAWASEGKRR